MKCIHNFGCKYENQHKSNELWEIQIDVYLFACDKINGIWLDFIHEINVYTHIYCVGRFSAICAFGK